MLNDPLSPRFPFPDKFHVPIKLAAINPRPQHSLRQIVGLHAIALTGSSAAVAEHRGSTAGFAQKSTHGPNGATYRHARSKGRQTVLVVAMVARGATGADPLQRIIGPGPDDAAAAKQAGWPNAVVATRAVTINAPRHQVYDYFRSFSNLPKFMVNIDSVIERDATHSHWTVMVPAESRSNGTRWLATCPVN